MSNSDEKISKKDLGKKYYEISLSAFVAAFLDGVSESTVGIAVTKGFDTFAKLQNVTVKELVDIGGFKESMAILLKYGIIEHLNEMKEYIKKDKVKIIMPNLTKENLEGYSFCFTGHLDLIDRTVAKEHIRKLGGATFNHVKKDLTFLVTNDTEFGSSKNRTAQEYGITNITEKEFLEIIEH
jgi:DNA ligase (NAD+)